MGTVMADFSGETALVTGASGGMGRAISLAFARAGASVILGDVDEVGGEETAGEIRAIGGRAVFLRTDVSNASHVQLLVDAAVKGFGRLDCAVNAAAVETETAALHEIADDNFDRMQSVNVRGMFLSMKYEIAAMLGNEQGGAIVNIASTNSHRPQHDQPGYLASKHAVLGLTRSAARDYSGWGIRINAICPGGIDTPKLRRALEQGGRDVEGVTERLGLVGRFGTPEEVAAASLWLCSDGASYTVGHALAVDAGYPAH